MRVLVTGSAGFVGKYLVEELMTQGHVIVGIDNHSRYGKQKIKSTTPYRFVEGDVNNVRLLKDLLRDCDHLVALAALVGGVGLFHNLPYDVLAQNEKITFSTFDAAIHAHKHNRLKKITIMSSSMVFETSRVFPTPESVLTQTPPPKTTYGFQKLACEYTARGAWQQYKLPFTIIRPGNVVGIGESNRQMNHVIPDIIHRVIEGEDPLRILGTGKQVRHFIYAGDLAKGIVLSLNAPRATNEDFNMASNTSTTILQLAKHIWKKVNKKKPFRYVSEKAFKDDVTKSVPAVQKAFKLLGFAAETSLDDMLDLVIAWVIKHKKNV